MEDKSTAEGETTSRTIKGTESVASQTSIPSEAASNEGETGEEKAAESSANDSEMQKQLEKERIEQEKKNIPFPSCRLVLTVTGFFGFLLVYAHRVDMSVTLVEMVNATYVRQVSQSHPDAVDKCGGDVNTTGSKNKTEKHEGTFKFDPEKQNVILSAFFYGYICLQIPGGTVAQKFGGKVVLLSGMFVVSVLTLLIPLVGHTGGFGGLVAVRVISGLAQSVSYPAMHAILVKWATPHERGRICMFVYAGAKIGIIITNPLSGVISDSIGWEAVFYVFGSLGVLWSVLSFFFIYDRPNLHPRISPEELHYIDFYLDSSHKATLKVPWLAIATSLPVISLAFAVFVYQWGNFTLLTSLPQYFKFILNFDIKKNGLLSGLPYIFTWIAMNLTGIVCDVLIHRQIMSTTNVRKLMMSIGFIGSGVFLLAVGFVRCDNTVAVVMIVFSIGFSGVTWGGWSINQLDLGPRYAGTLMGITNGFGAIGGIVGPVTVGAITKHDQSRAGWRKFFYISLGFYVAGFIIYNIFGSGERQKWNDPVTVDTVSTDETTPEGDADKGKEQSTTSEGDADKGAEQSALKVS